MTAAARVALSPGLSFSKPQSLLLALLQGTGVDVFAVQPGMSQTDFSPKMVSCKPHCASNHSMAQRALPTPSPLSPTMPSPCSFADIPNESTLPQDYSQTESTTHNKMQQAAGQSAARGAISALYAATEPSLQGQRGCVCKPRHGSHSDCCCRQ